MGSLSSLYISQSYQSLAHLGTNNALSAGTMTILQDGLGNSLNISFDGTNISSSGNIYGANITGSGASINTGSFVSTSSFNSYTQSNDNKVNSLISATGSYATTGSNTFTGQQTIKDSLIIENPTNQLIYTQLAQNNVNGLFQFYQSGGNGYQFNNNVQINGELTASLQEGYVWVGGVGNVSKLVATSSFIDTFNSSSLVTTSSFNAYTSSTNNRLNNLETNSASVNISISNLNSTTASQATSISNLNQFSQSAQISINSLNAATSSYAISSSVAAVDAAQQSQINSLIAATGSYLTASADITALNAFTASQLTINSAIGVSTASLNTFTASAQISINNLNTFSASTLTRLTNIETTTASLNSSVTQLNASSASQQISIDNLNAATSSYITESETASFARTNIDNNFTANQTFTNITAVSASFTYVQTLYETASVIYSSGSNQFGDELTDVQTLSGSVKVQGSLTVNGTPVLTSSVDISGLVTTASFNAYTQSNDQRVSSLETNSASVNISISNINSTTASLNSSVSNLNTFSASTLTRLTNIETTTASLNSSITNINSFTQSQETKDTTLASVTSSLNSATASLFTSTSLSLTTASFDNGTRNLTFTKGNTTQFSVNIPDVSGSAPTTIYDTVYTGESITKGDPLYISGSQGANPIVFKADAAIPAKMPVTYVSNQTIGAGTTTEAIILGHIEGINLTGYTAGQSIYVAEGGGFSTSLPSGSNSITQLLGVITKGGSGGKGLVLNPGPAQLPGLDTGKMWVGNGNNQPTEITTASFASSASFNSYTSSNDQKVNSLISATGSYATTGSNSFNGNQTITGNLLVSGSDVIDVNVVGRVSITGPASGETPRLFISSSDASSEYGRGFQTLDTTLSTSLNAFQYLSSNVAKQSDSFVAVFNADFSTDVEMNMFANSSSIGFADWDNGTTFSYVPFLTVAPNVGNNPTPVMTRGLNVTGSVNITGQYLVNGVPISGGATINTGSFATTGSNTFFGQQTTNLSGTAQTVATSIAGNSTQVETDMYVDGGNYDTFNVLVSANNGVYLRDFNQSNLSTWLQIPTNTGNNPAPIMPRGLEVTGSTNIQNLTASLQQGYIFVGNASNKTTTVATSSFVATNQTGSFALVNSNNTFTAGNVFSNQIRYAGASDNDNLATTQLINNQSLITKNVSISSGNNSGSIQQLSMSTGSGGNASFQMQAFLSGTIADLSIFNQAGTTSGRMLANDILFAKNQGFPNTPATTFRVDATTISLNGGVNISGSFSAPLQEGYIWIGDITGKNTSISASLFATTGSNTFTGIQTITGSTPLLEVFATDGSETRLSKSILSINTTNTSNVAAGINVFATTGSNATFYLGVYDDPGFTTDIELKLKADSNGLSFNDWDNGTAFDYIPFMTLTPNVGDNPLPDFTRGLILSPIGAPTSPASGSLYFSSVDSHFYGWNGNAWKQLDN